MRHRIVEHVTSESKIPPRVVKHVIELSLHMRANFPKRAQESTPLDQCGRMKWPAFAAIFALKISSHHFAFARAGWRRKFLAHEQIIRRRDQLLIPLP